MQASDFSQFRTIIAITAEQYGKQMSADLIRFYFDGLAEQSLSEVKAAITVHVRDTECGQFMPKIADIIAAIPRKRGLVL